MPSILPSPSRPPAEQFGCAVCRPPIAAKAVLDKAPPRPFIPIERHLGRPMLAWTKPFYACSECEAIWLLQSDPVSRRYHQHPTPRGMARALLPEASLDEVLIPLFSWAPINAVTETALQQISAPAQALWDRLIAAWRHPEVSPELQAIILRQLALLLQPEPEGGPPAPQRWSLQDTGRFEKDLDKLRHSARAWGALTPDSKRHVEQLRRLLQMPGIIRSRPYGFGRHAPRSMTAEAAMPAVPGPKAPIPVSATLSGQGRADDRHRASIARRVAALLWPYTSYLPAVLCGFLLVDAVGNSQGSSNNVIAAAFFCAVMLVCNGAAVARNSGISGAPLGQIIWYRMSAIGDYLLFAVMFMVLSIGLAAAGLLEGTQQALLSLGILLGALMVRFWPFWIIPYLQPVERDLETPRAVGITRRSALRTAWQLTGEPGVLRNATLPWLTFTAATGGLIAAIDGLLGTGWRNFILYTAALPAWTCLTWALVERLSDRHYETD